MDCVETREHLEACEDCRLHIAIEARLRSEPVLDPPKGLVNRVMKQLPRRTPVSREIVRIAAAAGFLVAVAGVVFAAGLDQHDSVGQVSETIGSTLTTFRELITWQ